MSNPIFTSEEIADIARLKRDNNWTHQELAAYLQGKPMNNQDKPAFPTDTEESPFCKAHTGLTAREYAAIKLRVPDSGTDWLDAMIEKSMLNEFAGKAMQGLLISEEMPFDTKGQKLKDFLADCAYDYAQAMLKASKGE